MRKEIKVYLDEVTGLCTVKFAKEDWVDICNEALKRDMTPNDLLRSMIDDYLKDKEV